MIPDGRPVVESVTIPMKPLEGARLIVADADVPACNGDGVTEEVEIVKSVMWKTMLVVPFETGVVPMIEVAVTTAG